MTARRPPTRVAGAPPRFRYIGVTDECVRCQCCGRDNLRSTVVLAVLDADGNTEAVTYYGSGCAARALSVRGGSAAVLAEARAAHRKLAGAARFARTQLAFYGLPETGAPDRHAIERAALLYARVHADAAWAPAMADRDWRNEVADSCAHHQRVLADAALVGIP